MMFLPPYQFLRYILIVSLIIPLLLLIRLFLGSPDSPELPQLRNKSAGEASQRYLSHATGISDCFNQPFLRVIPTRYTQRLPDLRSYILYYGANHRPDSPQDSQPLRVGIRGMQKSVPVLARHKIYLRYAGGNGPVRWAIVEDEKQPDISPLWMEVTPLQQGAQVNVYLKGVDDQLVLEPKEFATFVLPQLPLPQTDISSTSWDLGPFRADATLFSKMGAVWFGQDELLNHFGDEDDSRKGKELIFFGDENAPYVLWASPGDCFIFADNQFKSVIPGAESRGKTLLTLVQAHADKLSFDLWDSSGQMKIPLDLPKAQSPLALPTFPIRLVGARSRTRWIAEINGKRSIIGDNDWLLLENGQIVSIESPELLEKYISGQMRGTLLAIEGAKKVHNEQHLSGVLIDPTRAYIEPYTIAISKPWERQNAHAVTSSSDDEDDEDDEDERIQIEQEDDDEEDEQEWASDLNR